MFSRSTYPTNLLNTVHSAQLACLWRHRPLCCNEVIPSYVVHFCTIVNRYFLFVGRHLVFFTTGYVAQHLNSHSEQLYLENIDKAV